MSEFVSNKKTVIIGGGAAGLIAGFFCAKEGDDTLIIEKNEKIGKKLYITGKGRCNLTNDISCEDFFNNVISNPRFLMSAIYSFSPQDTMNLFEENGLRLQVERGNRVFPASNKSSDVIKTLQKMLDSEGVKINLNEEVKSLIVQDGICKGVVTNKGKYFADKVIIATGGASYYLTGSTGDGYDFAKFCGHKIVDIKGGLVPFIIKNGCKNLAGLSLKNVTLNVYYEEKLKYSEFGEMLFTHVGVSGPIVLTLSSKINRLEPSKIKLFIDLKPALDEKKLDLRVLRDFEKFSSKQLKNALFELLPSTLISSVIGLSRINPEKKVGEISREERLRLVNVIKNYPLEFVSLADINEAIITAGGVSVKEINPKTMESKLCKNLYFAGEVIDCDALTGGFNLQIAFSTAYLAAKG